MKRWWWPVLMLFAVACSNGAVASCFGGGGFPSCCSTDPIVRRGATYSGSIPTSDGGVATQVKLVVGQGNARLTFTRDGVEVAENFTVRTFP